MSTRGRREPKTAGGAQEAVLLAIGDEVLRGEIVNANAAFLAERLSQAGLVLREHVVVSDEPPAIDAVLARLSKEPVVIVATGGLGPTEDDRTVDVVCNLLQVEAEPHKASLEAMKKRFSAHGFELTPNNLRQVRVPKGAEAMPNSNGIAPGFRVKLGKADAFFMPGVPREMERIFADSVAPAIAKMLAAAGIAPPATRVWHVYGMGESHIDHRLGGLLEGETGATLHFRTAAPENHVKVVVRGKDKKENQATLERIDGELRRRIGAGVYGIDDETFPLMVGKTLREGKATLAFAESCTGGYAGELITSEPGASDFFLGSIVSYSNELKVSVLGVKQTTLDAQGAVSEPCAKEMAEGAKKLTGATYAVAITGIAGSDKEGRGVVAAPAAPGGKAVGTICFAMAGPKSTKTTTKLFSGGRERIRRAAAFFALDMVRAAIRATLKQGARDGHARQDGQDGQAGSDGQQS